MRVESRLARIVREHPGWSDAAAVGFALISSYASAYYVAGLVGWSWTLVLNGLPPLVLAGRRQAPRRVLSAVLGLGLLQWALAVPINGVQVSALIALYTVARYDSRPAARTALAAALAMLAIAPLRQPFAGLGNTSLGVGMVVVVYLIGTNVGLRQAYLRALEERAERLERERDAAAETAALLERTRIARELHDVVAHHVSVMVVQAEGAGWAIDDRPEQARAAVAAITETGRSTLNELRRLLGVLRSDAQDGMAPQPGLAALPGLIESFRDSGLSIVLESAPAPASTGLPASTEPPAFPGLPTLTQLPESLQLAAFRIVQEGLTNVLKHAGPAARAVVTVRCLPPTDSAVELLVEIRDDGIGAGGPPESGAGPAGHGLIGIRERVALFGGRVQIGPGAGGGFTVRAVLPVPIEAGSQVRR
jgi:signal transduction histidine kinase